MSHKSHAAGIHPDTRIETTRYGSIHYYCPCGRMFYDLKKTRKHFQGRYRKPSDNCPLKTVA